MRRGRALLPPAPPMRTRPSIARPTASCSSHARSSACIAPSPVSSIAMREGLAAPHFVRARGRRQSSKGEGEGRDRRRLSRFEKRGARRVVKRCAMCPRAGGGLHRSVVVAVPRRAMECGRPVGRRRKRGRCCFSSSTAAADGAPPPPPPPARNRQSRLPPPRQSDPGILLNDAVRGRQPPQRCKVGVRHVVVQRAAVQH
jgi:hypothetical protein